MNPPVVWLILTLSTRGLKTNILPKYVHSVNCHYPSLKLITDLRIKTLFFFSLFFFQAWLYFEVSKIIMEDLRCYSVFGVFFFLIESSMGLFVCETSLISMVKLHVWEFNFKKYDWVVWVYIGCSNKKEIIGVLSTVLDFRVLEGRSTGGFKLLWLYCFVGLISIHFLWVKYV